MTATINITTDQILSTLDESISQTDRPIDQIRTLTKLRNSLESFSRFPVSSLREALETGFVLDMIPRTLAFHLEDLKANDARFELRISDGHGMSATFSQNQIVL